MLEAVFKFFSFFFPGSESSLRTLSLFAINDVTVPAPAVTVPIPETTADAVNASDTARQELKAALSYEGSPEERQARLFCKQLGINYDKLSKDEFVSLINILKKSSLLRTQPNKRGKNKKKRTCV